MNRLQPDSIRTQRPEAHKADFDPALPSALDMALASEEEILPSSGFLASVMERVQEEAARAVAPTPIPFPWQRAIPGVLLTLAALGWGGFESIRQLSAAFATLAHTSISLQVGGRQQMESAVWVAGALAVSFVCWWFSRTLTRRTWLM
jgi:hypothetical protein